MENQKTKSFTFFRNINLLIILLAIFTSACNMSSSDQSTQDNVDSSNDLKKSEGKVEKVPGFPGGKEKMMEFIQSNLVYPVEAKNAGIEGTVFVQFDINDDGVLENEQVIKGIGHGCDKAALDVIKSMPKWNAAQVDGKKKKVKISVPIKFELEKK